MVNRYSLRPYGDIVRATQTRPSLSTLPEPTMFAAGDLPLFCSSGLDPELLRHAAWVVRHAAAMSTDPTIVFSIMEASAVDLAEASMFQTADGQGALNAYRQRVKDWAGAGQQPIGALPPMTADEYDAQLQQTVQRAGGSG